MGPIEITAQSFTLSEVQTRYYSKRPFMANMAGPVGSERQRLEQLGQPRMKEIGKFDERVSLLAPPLLFQSRADVRSCASTVTTPFLEAQWELAKVPCPTSALRWCYGAACSAVAARPAPAPGLATPQWTPPLSRAGKLVGAGCTLFSRELFGDRVERRAEHLPRR